MSSGRDDFFFFFFFSLKKNQKKNPTKHWGVESVCTFYRFCSSLFYTRRLLPYIKRFPLKHPMRRSTRTTTPPESNITAPFISTEGSHHACVTPTVHQNAACDLTSRSDESFLRGFPGLQNFFFFFRKTKSPRVDKHGKMGRFALNRDFAQTCPGGVLYGLHGIFGSCTSSGHSKLPRHPCWTSGSQFFCNSRGSDTQEQQRRRGYDEGR